MHRQVALLAALAVMGCAAEKPKEVTKIDLADQLSPGCYTVDLFDPWAPRAPAENVPPDWVRFLGAWKNGAWDGHWCHDLYVTAVHADGSVEVLDAYGPWRDRGIEATVFKRRGWIRDGALRFLTQGGVTAEYRLAGNYLVGERKGVADSMDITMSRDGDLAALPPTPVAMVPLPPRKPVS